MGRNVIETIMGGVVLVVAGFFLAFAYSHADLNEVRGYELTTSFTRAGGLQPGADVRINGIKIGNVTSLNLDTRTYEAVVKLSIEPGMSLPKDTVATIASEGLMGATYVKLEPGRSPERIKPGGAIEKTKDYKALEEMVGEIIFLATEPGQPQKPSAPPPAAGAPEAGAPATGSGLDLGSGLLSSPPSPAPPPAGGAAAGQGQP